MITVAKFQKSICSSRGTNTAITYRFQVPNNSLCGLVNSLGRGLGVAAIPAGRRSRLVDDTSRGRDSETTAMMGSARRRPRRGWRGDNRGGDGETARRRPSKTGTARQGPTKAGTARRRPRWGWLARVRRRFSRSSEMLVSVYWEEFVRKRFPGNNCKRMTSFSLPQKRDFVTGVKTLCNLLRCQCCENNIARVYLSTL